MGGKTVEQENYKMMAEATQKVLDQLDKAEEDPEKQMNKWQNEEGGENS